MTDGLNAKFGMSWRILRSHVYLAASLLIYTLLNIAYLFWIPEQYLSDFDYYYSELILLTLVIGLFVSAISNARDSNTRTFWGFLILGCSTWLLVRILSFVTQSWSNSEFEIFKDVLFLFYFSFLIVAIELRPDRYSINAWLQRHSATAIGGVLLVFAIFGYFAILPLLSADKAYSTPFEVHAVLDGYLALRFLMVAVQTGSDAWRRLFGVFTIVFLLIVAADLLSWSYRQGDLVYVPGELRNLLWFAWYPAAMLASTIQPETTTENGRSAGNRQELPLASGLLIFGLALPLIHVVGYGSGMLAIDARQSRDVFVAGWIIIVSGLMFGLYYTVRFRMNSLQNERAEAEQKADKFEDQLNRELRIRSLGRLSAGLAHDFGNTVSAISIYAKTITDKVKRGESVSDDMHGLTEGVDYAYKLIGKLKTFGAASEKAATGSVDIGEEVRKTLDIIRPSLQPGVQLDFVDYARGMMVPADSAMVHQVVTNYIYNAIDAVGDSGQIEIEIENRAINARCSSCGYDVVGRYTVLHVSDSGPGVSASLAGQVFEPLVTTKPVGLGSGLGLSTVSGIMHNIGGHVRVANNEVGGASFFAYFPINNALR